MRMQQTTKRQLDAMFICVCCLWLCCPALRAEEPRSAADWLTWFSENWSEETWGPSERRGYMRPLDDKGWQARMRAMQGIVANGADAVPDLVTALTEGDSPTRILAAQTLGYLAPHAPRDALSEALTDDPDAAVRLYAVDSLGMQGGSDLTELLQPRQKQERNRDAKKHIAYALERKKIGVDRAVLRSLVEWDVNKINSAKIGHPAPDFQLTTVSGKKYRLSDFRGKQSVVLVFIYGDT